MPIRDFGRSLVRFVLGSYLCTYHHFNTSYVSQASKTCTRHVVLRAAWIIGASPDHHSVSFRYFPITMPSLLDHIDRFNYLVKETQDAAERTVETRDGPSSVAMLNMGLGDLARDIDASELGLFTVVEPTAARVYSEEEAMSQPMPELTRVEFHGATPLRRPAAGVPHLRAEKEPEVYAQAALRYLQQ